LNCDATRKFIHAYADGELDLVSSLEVEEHLEDCFACSQALRNLQSLKSSLHDESLYFNPPAHLQASIRAAIREADRPSPSIRRIPWGMMGLAAALVLALGVVWLIGRSFSAGTKSSGEVALAQSVVSSHVRSLMANHLSDVESSDKHTVKPWFDGKLDFSPPVQDLAAQGFPLLGGRLDYLENRPVAALVYGRQKHIINLLVWPATNAPAAGGAPTAIQGYNIVHWNAGDMTYWAVSDLNTVELQQFAQLIKDGAQ
jgi:anti-sigma factor RsiW